MTPRAKTICRAIIQVGAFLVAFAIFTPMVLDAWTQAVASFLGRDLVKDGTDFAVFYAAGQLVWSGRGHEIYNIGVIGLLEWAAAPQISIESVLPYLNPPFFAALVAPLTNLPFKDAYRVWTMMNVALITATCCMTWCLVKDAPVRWRLLSLAGVLTLYPAASALREGQFSFIIAASWLLTYILLRQGKGHFAGLAFVPVLIKPELTVPVLLFMAWKRDWAFVGSFGLSAGALVIISVAIVGIPEAIHYPQYLIDIASRDGYGTNTSAFFGWNGILAASVGRGNAALVTLASIPLIITTFAIIARAWRGPLASTDGSFPAFWAALTFACILADPHYYIHDMVLVGTVWGGLVSMFHATHARQLALWGFAGWALLAPGYQLHPVLHINPFGWLMIGALLTLAFHAERTRRFALMHSTKSTVRVPERSPAFTAVKPAGSIRGRRSA